MKICYRFLDDKGLMIKKYIGDPCLNTYINYLDAITKEEFFPRLKYIITDLTGMKIDQVKLSAQKISEIRKEKVSLSFTEVMVVATPDTTAFATLFKKEENENAKFNYCSTFEKALTLLPVEMSIEELKEILQNIENYTCIS
ncbi:hypothetical protein GCM10011414_17220 [Croceivirga lutea]|uniref:hypothetical protein n=1 Tax=Croceivirga lutea TaxID=1775167 RepID=UPI00163ABFD6|nr:hypothetical protein [Croceivirga lutea]GGG48028.1 hypothetical protein GCM10011414_17220 [Croceivirga lutea]